MSNIANKLYLTCTRFILFFALSIYLSGCAANPVTGARQLILMPEEKEVALGKTLYPVYTQASDGLFQDKGLQEYINRVGKKIAGLSHRPNLDYEFNVVNASVVNAYALPGGKISITRGLLTLMKNEDQLAGVLAHEITHVAAKHAAAGYSRAALANLGLSLLSTYLGKKETKYGEYSKTAGALAANLVMLKYSRNQEHEADKFGMEYMVKASYNPQGLVQVLELLLSLHEKEPSRLEAMMQSHPLSSERVANSKAQMDTDFALHKVQPLQIDEFQKHTAYLQSVAEAYKHYDKGEELAAKEKFEEAVIELKKAAELSPQQALIHTALAAAYFGQNKYNEAIKGIDTSIQLYPDLFKTRFLAGFVYHHTENLDLSIEHLNTADKLIPDNINVIFYLGLNYEKKGNIPTSAGYYKKLLGLTTKGEKAEHAYTSLLKWGYIRAAQ